MRRCSETIGKIAAALAQAQTLLQNPERSLTATIMSPFPRESAAVSFRYASLATGLDIVRKTLGEQEIATIQTTSVDQEAGLIRLETMLAHSSGEWIASDWPVCGLAEVAAPHRLGTALTYARRYALFTLAGIAGEDDLDAPDLPIAPATLQKPVRGGDEAQSTSGGLGARKAAPLNQAQSATLRSRLLTELETVQTVDDLTLWALRRLPLKRRLTEPDARLVDVAYRARLNSADPQKSGGEGAGAADRSGGTPEAAVQIITEAAPTAQSFEPAIIQLPKVLRRRDKAHLAFVASQPCLVCQRTPADAHHLKFAQPRALGRKSSDEFTVPLCRDHHRELHRSGNERAWWAAFGIAPLDVADRLWRTHQRES